MCHLALQFVENGRLYVQDSCIVRCLDLLGLYDFAMKEPTLLIILSQEEFDGPGLRYGILLSFILSLLISSPQIVTLLLNFIA